MAGALAGIRVVDLSVMASGPLATQILGEQGADVIKVEPPGSGDLLRHIGTARGGMSAVFNTLNRNKRSLVLDLSRESGRDVLRRLVSGADVFVQNFRPGAVERMGLDAARLQSLAPDLIYVSISGFGERGPYAGRRVYDSIMQAVSGFAAHQADPGTGVPEFIRNIVCDKATALFAAQAITAALLARERGGGGQHLRLAMIDAGIAFLWPDGMQNHTYIGEGTPPPMSRATLPSIRETADGYMAVTAINDREFAGLVRALERPELLEDPRFRDAGGRTRHAGALHDVINAVTRTRSSAELARRFEAEEVPHGIVNRLEALHEDPQVRANGTLEQTEHPSAGPMRAPRPVVRFEHTPAVTALPAPALGEHSDAVLAEIGLDGAARDALRRDGVLG